MSYTRNKNGGLEPVENYLISRAKKADLVTLPKDVAGTNCFNCKFISNKMKDKGFCRHPQIQMLVNGKMCCALWDATGVIRPFKKDVKYT